jgi:hypothetical protein
MISTIEISSEINWIIFQLCDSGVSNVNVHGDQTCIECCSSDLCNINGCGERGKLCNTLFLSNSDSIVIPIGVELITYDILIKTDVTLTGLYCIYE